MASELVPSEETLAAWPNCETPDCENKCCTWSRTPFCFPCAERLIGNAELIARYNLTHDLTWEQARELERLEDILDELDGAAEWPPPNGTPSTKPPGNSRN